MPLIRSISGLRATLGDALLPEIISKNVAAFEKTLPKKKKVVIGRDGRPSGKWIVNIVAGTLSACGRDVVLLGVVPTPTVQMAVEHSDAAGGISITASHNPEQWNGLKFINSSGVFFDLKENTKMWKAEEFGEFNFVKTQEGGTIEFDEDAIDKHINSILSIPIFDENSLKTIKNKKFKVVVDAVNASGSVAIPQLLETLGCKVIKLHCDGTGIFPHTPEPIPKNLKNLAERVKKEKADLGIAVDPDADRLVLIDNYGNPIGEERTIALAVNSVLENLSAFKVKKSDVSVVVNQSTTQAIEDICNKHEIRTERSAVGEINVVKAMKKFNAVIGGEGSGGVILPACHYGRDSMVGISLLLHQMATTKTSLSDLVNELPQYQMVKKKCMFNGDLTGVYSKIVSLFPNGKAFKGDGVKIMFPGSWIQVRASNTEPIIRVIAEDPSFREAKKMVNTVIDACQTF